MATGGYRLFCGIIVFSICWGSTVMAQHNNLEQSVTISFADISVRAALESLETATHSKFSYNPEQLPDRLVNDSFDQIALRTVLSQLLGSSYDILPRGSFIIIHYRHPVKSESITLSGTILDSQTGKAIPNVSVYDANVLNATLTNEEGGYEVSVKSYDAYAVVAISKIHYKDTIIQIPKTSGEPLVLQLQPIATGSVGTQKNSLNSKLINRIFKNRKIKEHERNVDLSEDRLFQLALVPVIGTNGLLGSSVTNSLSLNVIAGYAHALHGLEIGGAINIEKKEMHGAQIAGVMNFTGTETQGIQLAGFSNTTLAQAKGWMVAGAANMADSLNGVQLSGASNYVHYLSKGIQLSGAVNYSGELQGIQIAAGYNHVKETVTGVQLSGGVNWAKELRGVQIGVVNLARTVEHGAMIGLLNIAGDGFIHPEMQSSDVLPFTLAFKSGTQALYSILAVGISPWEQQSKWAYGLGFGTQPRITPKTYLQVEATSWQLQALDHYISELSIDNRLSLCLGFSFAPHVSINAGPVFHYFIFDASQNDSVFYDSVGNWKLFSRKNQKAWIGYQVGVRF